MTRNSCHPAFLFMAPTRPCVSLVSAVANVCQHSNVEGLLADHELATSVLCMLLLRPIRTSWRRQCKREKARRELCTAHCRSLMLSITRSRSCDDIKLRRADANLLSTPKLCNHWVDETHPQQQPIQQKWGSIMAEVKPPGARRRYGTNGLEPCVTACSYYYYYYYYHYW